MTRIMTRLADRALQRVVPRVEVAAGCVTLETCYCQGYVRFSRKCYRWCPGVPINYCTGCTFTSTC